MILSFELSHWLFPEKMQPVCLSQEMNSILSFGSSDFLVHRGHLFLFLSGYIVLPCSWFVNTFLYEFTYFFFLSLFVYCSCSLAGFGIK